jgi:hypothetical protein
VSENYSFRPVLTQTSPNRHYSSASVVGMSDPKMAGEVRPIDLQGAHILLEFASALASPSLTNTPATSSTVASSSSAPIFQPLNTVATAAASSSTAVTARPNFSPSQVVFSKATPGPNPVNSVDTEAPSSATAAPKANPTVVYLKTTLAPKRTITASTSKITPVPRLPGFRAKQNIVSMPVLEGSSVSSLSTNDDADHEPDPEKFVFAFDDTAWSTDYLRNNKNPRDKKLRCFPRCRAEGHCARGFCGDSVCGTLEFPR